MSNMRVWWIHNPPSKPKHYPVDSIEEAINTIKKLTAADLVAPQVEANAGGLEVLENGEWSEYYNGYGQDIMDIMDEQGDL